MLAKEGWQEWVGKKTPWPLPEWVGYREIALGEGGTLPAVGTEVNQEGSYTQSTGHLFSPHPLPGLDDTFCFS